MKGQQVKKQVTDKEKASYAFYFVEQNIFCIFLMSYLNVYVLDIGISALVLSGPVLVVKVWDAVNDPIYGGIVDRTKFMKGKFLPWLRISLFAIPAATILLFTIPSNVSPMVQIIWAAISYILWDTAYTICDVPIFGIITTMTSEQTEHTSLMAIGRVAALIAAVLVSILVPQFREAMGGWLPMAVLLSLLGLLFMIPICLTAKERIKPKTSAEDVTLKQMFTFFAKNKYMLIFYSVMIISQSASIGNSIGLITARLFFGDEGLSTIMTIVALLPTILLGGFIPAILKKVDKATLYTGAMIGSAVLGVIAFFVGYHNFTLYIIITALKGIIGVIIMLMFMFAPNTSRISLAYPRRASRSLCKPSARSLRARLLPRLARLCCF